MDLPRPGASARVRSWRAALVRSTLSLMTEPLPVVVSSPCPFNGLDATRPLLQGKALLVHLVTISSQLGAPDRPSIVSGRRHHHIIHLHLFYPGDLRDDGRDAPLVLMFEEHAGNMHNPLFRHLDSQAGRAEIHLSESGLDPLGLRQALKGL